MQGPTKERKQQIFYMQEFASRVDSLLQALLSREALAHAHCGRWRCKDCFLPQPLCRSCMRHTHMNNPFHHIEFWTSTHFQPAELWQVGMYIQLRHHDSAATCQYMQWQEESYIADNAAANLPSVAAPLTDNTYVWVIHTNGVHHLALVTCSCSGVDGLPEDLIQVGLVPTSFKRVRTLFTLAVLDQFRYSNLEMKASAYQFFQMLRRITMPMASANVVNFYHELRRLSRLWRWVKKLKWAGFGHKDVNPMDVAPGELAVFCLACPQPGINLPDNWLMDENHGNFKADHVKNNNAAPDLWLSDGGGMMTRWAEYKDFLHTATERLTKAPCENTFCAIEQAMLLSKACDITGIVAIACARHGCFAPNSIVDLTWGEQQKNVDWAFLEAIRTTSVNRDQGVMLMYDIACQYFIHLQDRIGNWLPLGLDIDWAIGLFHVHAHKEACFFQYASSFIPGTGVCAGEILKCLWSNLNTITPATRTATLAHRAEIIDDHAADSNHRKTLGIATTLVKHFKESVDMVKETVKYYDPVTSTIAETDIAEWTESITAAEERRLVNPAAMDILATHQLDSLDSQPSTQDHILSIAEDWCRLALCVEERQIDRVRRLGKEPHEDDRQEVERLRQLLAAELAQVLALQNQALATSGHWEYCPFAEDMDLFDNLDDNDTGAIAAQGNDMDAAQPLNADATQPLTADATQPLTGLEAPELHQVVMPSNMLEDGHPLRSVELSLRKQQAERYLNTLREAIADKSFQFSHKSVRTRARTIVGKLNDCISLYSHIYKRCRVALREHVSASTTILDPNRPGASSLCLSWIWQTLSNQMPQSPESVHEFKQVHWLRARAQKNRWKEEQILVGYEMEWSVRYFLYRAKVWEERCNVAALSPGAIAYAARQNARWQQVAVAAESLFKVRMSIISHDKLTSC
ncbi:hypothetical protein BYT27DRAFT_7227787 [Phlegmacium glaucopus]|nr:hypothetical protein BYT27DRAFT_7227787 [Phlegmacium glaucopus]